MESGHTAARILVIDDDDNLRKILHGSLEEFGYYVESFTDCEAAMLRYENHAFDAVITDFSMPVMNGFEIARHVKNLNPEVPVLLVSGEQSLAEDVSYADSGIDLFLPKPYRIRDIVKSLRRLLMEKS